MVLGFKSIAITLFVICFCVATQIVNDMGIFGTDTLPVPDNQALVSQIVGVSDPSNSNSGFYIPVISETIQTVDMTLQSLGIVYSAVKGILCIAPTLQKDHIPLPVAAGIQAIIWALYGFDILAWRMNRDILPDH